MKAKHLIIAVVVIVLIVVLWKKYGNKVTSVLPGAQKNIQSPPELQTGEFAFLEEGDKVAYNGFTYQKINGVFTLI